MTQVKRYKIGKYNSDGTPIITEVLRAKRHNRTYKNKPTKFVKNENMKEAVKTVTFLVCTVLIGVIIEAFPATNNIEILAAGAEVGEVTITAEAPAVDYSGIPYMVKESKVMEISAYSELDSCHYPTKGGCLTASGKIAEVGMVATNLYTFGTKLRINGEIYTVEDRISKRYNDRIDRFMGYGQRAHDEAIEFGIQHLEVEIIN